jgi:hypothetical protein
MPHRYSLCTLILTVPFLGWAAAPAQPTELVVRLEVQAMPAPKPPLRYQLLPDLRQMNPGNPVLGFANAIMLMAQEGLFNKQAAEQWNKWDELPLKDLPIDKLRGYGEATIAQAKYAARLDTPDWQVLLKMKSEGFSIHLIPEVQRMRELAQVLKRRMRVEIAQGHFDDALNTAEALFALARVLGEHPTLVAHLVAVALVAVNVESLDEMLGQPGCPNLLWALTDLPRPFVDFRKALQGERILDAPYFENIDDKALMKPEQLQRVLDKFESLFGRSNAKDKTVNFSESVERLANDKDYARAARQRLVKYGLADHLIQQFPPLQIVLLDGKIGHEVNLDEVSLAITLPYWQAEPLLAKTRDSVKIPFFQSFVAATYKVRLAQARMDQRLAMLRCVEAMRIYAAEHDGKLPPRLDDIKLPLPLDPINGEPFRYKLEGSTAHLRGTPPPGTEKNAHFNVHYDVTIRK